MSISPEATGQEGREPAYISLTAWLTPSDLAEQLRRGEAPTATLHLVIPHGTGKRTVQIRVGLDQCLALCANAADAARVLAPYREVGP